MEKLTLDIKTLFTVCSMIGMLAGFYYSTQHRLDTLEGQIAEISQKLDSQRG